MCPEEWEDEDALIDDYMKRRTQTVPETPQPKRPAVERKEQEARRETYLAIILLALFLGSIYLFWVLPYQLGSHPVRVNFERKK